MKVGIVGAGSIGCYVGAVMQLAGAEVHFLLRPRMAETLSVHGLRVSDLRGLDRQLGAESLHLHTEAAAMTGLDCLFVTVKSADTAAVAEQLAGVLNGSETIVSLQNGVGNAAQLRQSLPNQPVLAGMIAFNVLNCGEGHFHAGTDGAIMVEECAAMDELASLFAATQTPFEWQPDMVAVQWSKLLLNLNNPINALSGLPLKDELSQRAYRRCLALLQTEALQAIRAAGLPLLKLTAVPPSVLPWVLRSPDWLFRKVAQPMLRMDPLARSSMWEDLELGRRTEVDWLNGEVADLARRHGLVATANERVRELIKAAEQGGRRDFSGEELLALLRA